MFIEGLMPNQESYGIYLNTKYILHIRKLDESICIEFSDAIFNFDRVRIGNFVYKADDLNNLIFHINQG